MLFRSTGALEKLRRNKELLDQNEAKIERAEKDLGDRIRSLKESVEILSDRPEKQAELSAKRDKLRELRERMLTILKEQAPLLIERQKDHKAKASKYLEARDQFDKAAIEYQSAERILEDCRAGILALRLKEGQKCPVCGSVHHPEPAGLPERSVTEEEVKNLKATADKLREKKDKAMAESESAKSAFEEAGRWLRGSAIECLMNPLVKKRIGAMKPSGSKN